ncbi:MAG: hypothetical protein M1470_08570 [Bacteroidetes bacterium]|nr:hypothetical protein [Bacteroidota bacterium]MCL5737964.1 hypothetical protein [Bacteroidota bacterium]
MVDIFCAGSLTTNAAKKFAIDYYTIGGIAGTTSGVTLSSDGWLKHWRGRSAALRTVADSLRVDRKVLERITELLDKPEVFSFSYEAVGNLTYVLKIQSGDKYNSISFDQVGDIKGFPESLQKLLSELNKLSNN